MLVNYSRSATLYSSFLAFYPPSPLLFRMLFDTLQPSLRLCLCGIENFKDGWVSCGSSASLCLPGFFFFLSWLNRGRVFLRRLTEVESQSHRIYSARLSTSRLHLDHSAESLRLSRCFALFFFFFSHWTPWRRSSQLVHTSGIDSCSKFSNTEHLHGLSLLLQGRPAPSPCLSGHYSQRPVHTDTSCTVRLDSVFLYLPASHSSRGALPVGSGRPLASLSFLELRLLALPFFPALQDAPGSCISCHRPRISQFFKNPCFCFVLFGFLQYNIGNQYLGVRAKVIGIRITSFNILSKIPRGYLSQTKHQKKISQTLK